MMSLQHISFLLRYKSSFRMECGTLLAIANYTYPMVFATRWNGILISFLQECAQWLTATSKINAAEKIVKKAAKQNKVDFDTVWHITLKETSTQQVANPVNETNLNGRNFTLSEECYHRYVYSMGCRRKISKQYYANVGDSW
ncbi:Hypothetical predicted protein [Octopus vulgaris]|uniref:Uncharacterized protein n=1 Tax=Octopus vulgaris TaxID=6645 RepID=A0AA36F955_OCTVU|nr:Hypothetical predicted protein [Octopus vulgaris]